MTETILYAIYAHQEAWCPPVRDGFRIFDAHTHIGEARHSWQDVHRGDAAAAEWMSTASSGRWSIPFPVVEDYRRQHDLIGEALKRISRSIQRGGMSLPFPCRRRHFETRFAGAGKNMAFERSNCSRSITV